MSFSGRKALITGASKGLGKAIANRLASEGCSLKLLSRNEDLLRHEINQLPIINPSQTHEYISFDLNQLASSHSNARESGISELLNDVSILINCAGVTNHSLLYRMDESEILSTININLLAPVLLSRLAYKPMIRSHSKTENIPQILNVSSVLSLTNTYVPGTSVYAASKAGLLGFTTALAAELKGKVRVNALLPGLIQETDMGTSANINDEVGSVTLDSVVSKAVGILSDESINGQCIICDNNPTSKIGLP
ncbi:hypothetical protein DFJ63DRAFT_337699 [Scheffersomyces coipomensis]|uniref:uncharacterized protein n=1 Tax=Scheffersomyces coipomensis TaxID=1788519 RepID=UPI00315D352A